MPSLVPDLGRPSSNWRAISIASSSLAHSAIFAGSDTWPSRSRGYILYQGIGRVPLCDNNAQCDDPAKSTFVKAAKRIGHCAWQGHANKMVALTRNFDNGRCKRCCCDPCEKVIWDHQGLRQERSRFRTVDCFSGSKSGPSLLEAGWRPRFPVPGPRPWAARATSCLGRIGTDWQNLSAR